MVSRVTYSFAALQAISTLLKNEGVVGVSVPLVNFSYLRLFLYGAGATSLAVIVLDSIKKSLPQNYALEVGVGIAAVCTFGLGAIFGVKTLKKVEYITVDDIMIKLPFEIKFETCRLISTYIGDLEFFNSSSLEEAINSVRIKKHLYSGVRRMLQSYGYVIIDKNFRNKTLRTLLDN